MLEYPRVYNWTPDGDTNRAGQPFVNGETRQEILAGPGRHCLIAGDGHRIPFPREILESDRYCHAPSCNVRLFVETDNRPYPGVNYVMEINLPGDPHRTLNLAAEIVNRSLGYSAPPLEQHWYNPIPAVAGIRAGLAVLLTPAPLNDEAHWLSDIELANGHATVRYDYLP